MRRTVYGATTIILLGLSLNTVSASTTFATPDDARQAAAAHAAGCVVDKDAPVALAPLPGEAADLQVTASLTGGASADGLGQLCVAVVREAQGHFVPVAALSEKDQPNPPSEVDPVTNTGVSVDRTPFRFAPIEAAFAVRASGEFNSTSTNASWSTLYLFRRQGERLTPIFHAEVESSELDKDSGKTTTAKAMIVRFDTRLTNGAYDLILAPKRGGKSKRFTWTGSRYAEAR